MRFPVTIRHRSVRAKIYAPRGKFAYYRVAYATAGKRRMQTFAAYSAAKVAAKRIVRELAKGSQAAALSASQSRDALAAFERLEDYFKAKGKRISLNAAVGEYIDAVSKLNVPLSSVVTGFLSTEAMVKRVDLAVAVKEFVDAREAETKSVNGKRPGLSRGYFLNTKLWLCWFAEAFPATAVWELTREHLDLFMAGRSHLAAKSKNHLRATVKMFLNWCIKKDYLPANHRLMDAPGMQRQQADIGETDFFRPAELRAMLNGADDTIRPIIALQALAGIRLQEAQRLTWQDVFGVARHIAISATKSKTRSRRLVEMCPALAAWLKPYRLHQGALWTQSRDTYHAAFVELRQSQKIPARKNGLRHGFCTYHFALHDNENLTAAQAGRLVPGKGVSGSSPTQVNRRALHPAAPPAPRPTRNQCRGRRVAGLCRRAGQYSDPRNNEDLFVGEEPDQNENKATLQQIAPEESAKFTYEYDFGDSWEHKVIVEKILPHDAAVATTALCVDGARACPPEDCGGVWGYAELLKTLKNPKHAEHERMKEWIGGSFDAEAFDVDNVNLWLRKLKWPRVTEAQLRKVLMGRDNCIEE